uniref:Uncharacterized protein n=1 Tax=Arundo donax TaxID=35708 RepID=A0A0A9GLJ4_ARUDO
MSQRILFHGCILRLPGRRHMVKQVVKALASETSCAAPILYCED